MFWVWKKYVIAKRAWAGAGPSSGLPKEESPRHAAFSQRRSLESLSHVTAISTKSLQHVPTTVMSTGLFNQQDSSLLVGFLADDKLGPELAMHTTGYSCVDDDIAV